MQPPAEVFIVGIYTRTIEFMTIPSHMCSAFRFGRGYEPFFIPRNPVIEETNRETTLDFLCDRPLADVQG